MTVWSKRLEAADPICTLPQVSLAAGIPHVHACGGNARCSTCRVMVHEWLECLSPRNPAELKLALRKGMKSNIRLACPTQSAGRRTRPQAGDRRHRRRLGDCRQHANDRQGSAGRHSLQ